MIEETTLAQAETFRAFWQQQFAGIGSMELDYSWPTVDLLICVARGYYRLKPLSDNQKNYLRGLSSYLSVIVHECWLSYVKNVSVSTHSEKGVIIVGDHPSAGRLELTLEKTICSALEQGLRLVNSARGTKRILADDWGFFSTLLSAMADASICSPDNRSLPSPAEEKEFIRKLANSCAAYYAKNFTAEQIGQTPDLYLTGLIYPPPHFSEAIIGANAAQGLANFILDNNLTSVQTTALLHNLIMSPQEQIALAAAICLLAFAEGIDEFVLLCHEIHGPGLATLRPNICQLRRTFDFPEDWILSSEFESDEKQRFFFEKNAGLIPWIVMDLEFISRKKEDKLITLFLKLLADLNSSRAYAVLVELEKAYPQHPELMLQRVHLDLLHNLVARAITLCQGYELLYKNKIDWRLSYNFGCCYLAANNLSEAKSYFLEALNIMLQNNLGTDGELTDIYLKLSSLCYGQNNYVEADQYALKANKINHLKILPALERVRVAIAQKSLDTAKQILTELLKINPANQKGAAYLSEVLFLEQQALRA
ncbi:MAG: hypothetical protein IT292_04315 [Deltaproteobacteria bacterium]|nr:hypothetical protein [Deltaproteobacteria bacterium]